MGDVRFTPDALARSPHVGLLGRANQSNRMRGADQMIHCVKAPATANSPCPFLKAAVT